MSTNKKKYVGEEAAQVLAAGIGAATPRTWDLTPDDLESVTEEEQDGMALLQFPTSAKLKTALPEIKVGDRLEVGNIFETPSLQFSVASVQRYEEYGNTSYEILASVSVVVDNASYCLRITNNNVEIVVLPLLEPEPQKLSPSAGGSSWQYGAIPNWGDLGEQSSCWSYTDHGSSSMPHDFKIGDTFRTPTLVPYGCPPSEASDDPADQAAANYAEGTIVGAGKIQNVPYLVVVGAARFGKKTSSTAKDDETITAPGIFYITSTKGTGSSTFWYVKFYPLLNRWKELEKVSDEILVVSAGLEMADEKINVTRDKLGGLTNAARPRVIVGRLPRIGNKGTHNYYLTPKLPGDGSWIPVRLSTRAFNVWLNDETTTKPFTIEAVGLERVYLSLAPGNPRKYIKPEFSPVNITVENGVATITKKTPGCIWISPYGLHADMAVYGPTEDFECSVDGRLVVRYDEERGWTACDVPLLGGGFAIDRLSPPTYAEVVRALYGRRHYRSKKNRIQIQFRSRAVRPKGSTATEATKKYHFWSYKKKWGTVFRVRRTLGARYCRVTNNPDTGNTVKTPSYAHRNFGASEWHYYSVRWLVTTDPDGKKERRILKLRRLG